MSNSSEWTTIKFGDLVEGHRGVSYQPCDLLDGYIEESVVLLRANNIQQGRLQFHDIQIVPKHLVKNTQYLSIGDVAVCMSNGSKHLVGKSAQLVDKNTFDCTIGAFCSVFRPKEGSDPTFVKQLFLSNSYQAHIDLSLAGSAINNLKNSDIESIIFKIPSKPRQKKIAAILGTIDRTITHTEALIEKYQQIKAGLMHDLFTRGIGADGKLRPPRDQAPEMYRESSIGWIPKEWMIKPIGQVFSIQLGKMLSPLAKMGKSECSYLNNRSVHWDNVDIENLSSMDFNIKEREKFKLIYGDLLVCEGGDVGRTAMWRDDLENCYFQKTIHRLRSLNGDVLPELMLRFMLYAKNTGMFSNFTSQTSIAHLTREKLLTVNVFVPSITEQEQLVKRFDSIDQNIATEISFLDKLEKQKSGLMNDLLTGKVQVNINSAEAVND